MKFEIQVRSAGAVNKRVVEVARDQGRWLVILDNRQVDVDVAEVAPNTFSILLNGCAFEISVVERLDGSLQLQTSWEEFVVDVFDPRAWRGRHSATEAEGRQQIVAPMPGKIVRVLVQEGEIVEAGQGLLVVEAMKMQNEIRSPKNGKVAGLHAKEGQPVNVGEILAWVD